MDDPPLGRLPAPLNPGDRVLSGEKSPPSDFLEGHPHFLQGYVQLLGVSQAGKLIPAIEIHLCVGTGETAMPHYGGLWGSE
jgi:hypothetical protein